MPEQSNDYRVAVFGAGGVGKSSLVLRFVRGTFRENYVPTIEDTYRQVISSNKQVGDEHVSRNGGVLTVQHANHQAIHVHRLFMGLYGFNPSN